jgi:hypothetical protein
MYKPTNSINMTNAELPQIRLGLQGPAASGKTWAATTFPNPVFMDIDNGLTAHRGRDILRVPFYDPTFIRQLCPNSKVTDPPNRRDAVRFWLRDEGNKLEPDQTLVVDSWTTLQNAFDQQTELEPVRTRQGLVDEFAFWAKKIDYSRDIMELLMGLRCHVVVCFHEISQRDPKTGLLLEKLQPLMQGKFVAQLKVYFTDFFRQHAIGKLDEQKQVREINGKKLTEDTTYMWQIKSDAIFDAKTRMNRPEIVIPASFSSFTY